MTAKRKRRPGKRDTRCYGARHCDPRKRGLMIWDGDEQLVTVAVEPDGRWRVELVRNPTMMRPVDYDGMRHFRTFPGRPFYERMLHWMEWIIILMQPTSAEVEPQP